MARSSGSVMASGSTASGVPLSVPKLRANRLAFMILMARRRPFFIWPSSNAVSVPGRPLAAQYRTASEPCWSRRSSGVTTLPLDLDIFLRSGSRIHPLRAQWPHGAVSASKWERTAVENSQVRMMSWAWGRRSMG